MPAPGSHGNAAAGERGRGRAQDVLRYLGALLILVQGGIHLQQLISFIHLVPYVGPLFALNAAGAVGIALGLLTLRRLHLLAALGGILQSVGAIVSLALAETIGFLGYQEPTFRPAVTLAFAVEAAGTVVLLLYVAARARARRSGEAVR